MKCTWLKEHELNQNSLLKDVNKKSENENEMKVTLTVQFMELLSLKNDDIVAAGVDFTNILMHSFYTVRSQKCKNSDKLSVSLWAFGICTHKSMCKMLMKWTPTINFLNILCARFLYEFFAKAKV